MLAQLPQYEPPEGIHLLTFMKVCIYFCAYTVFEGAMVSFANRIEARYDKAKAQKPPPSRARGQRATHNFERHHGQRDDGGGCHVLA